MGRVQLIGAVHLARAHNVQRQITRKQRAHLHRRRVSAQQQVSVLRLNVESVLHFACRVIRLNVQSVKVVPLRLQLRAVCNLPAHTDENISQALLHQSNRVAAAQRTARRSSRNVHSFLSQDASLTLSLQLSGTSLNSLSQGCTSLTHQLTHRALVLVLKITHLAVSDAHDALLTEEAQAHLLEAVKVLSLLANLLLGTLTLSLKSLTDSVQTVLGVLLQNLRNAGENLSRAVKTLVFLHGIGHCHSSLHTTGTMPAGSLYTLGSTACSPPATHTGCGTRGRRRAHILSILDQRRKRKQQNARIVHPGVLRYIASTTVLKGCTYFRACFTAGSKEARIHSTFAMNHAAYRGTKP